MILRLAPELEAFEKERYASEHFSSRLPIPRLAKLGTFDENIYFAVSVRAPGDVLANLDQATVDEMLPQFIALIDDIRNTQLPLPPTFGWWERSGEGLNRTWNSYLLPISSSDGYHWPQLMREGRVDCQLLQMAQEVLATLTRFCPEERHLIHGDFGLQNVLSDGQSITGVIDWGEARYGDFLYDVAWLDFCWPSYSFSEILYRRFLTIGLQVQNYQERLLWYKLHCALGLMPFFAGSHQ